MRFDDDKIECLEIIKDKVYSVKDIATVQRTSLESSVIEKLEELGSEIE